MSESRSSTVVTHRLSAAWLRARLGQWTGALLVLLGCAACVHGVISVGQLTPGAAGQVGAGVLLALLASQFPVRIARSEQSFSAAGIFTILLLLMHGPAAAGLAAAAETWGGRWRRANRRVAPVIEASAAALAMVACGSVLQAVLPLLSRGTAGMLATLLMAAMLFGSLHHAASTALMAALRPLLQGRPASPEDFGRGIGWTGIAHAATAAIAALLFIEQQRSGLTVMLAMALIVGLLFTTLHFFTLQQQADDAVRQAAADAVEREAELAASIARERAAALKAQHVRELALSERRFHNAFTHAPIGMALMSFDGHIRQANPALHTLLGFEGGDLETRLFTEVLNPLDAASLQREMARVMRREAESLSLELCCRHSDGSEVWVIANGSLFSEPGAHEPCFILQIQDISARRRAEHELRHRAFHDKLTGLPNRDRFNELLSRALDAAHTDPSRRFAVLFLDFDRFKLINDSQGHAVGDEFLVRASGRLHRCLRHRDTLARLGGDEFAILADDLAHDGDAVTLAERLLESLREPLGLPGIAITASASIGITFSSMGYRSPEDMLRDADIAMYRAKVDGKARFALFDVRLHTEVSSRLRLEADLREALERRQLTVAYQPMFELATGRLQGFEALARWNHPTLGPVSPGTFIPIAEESGLVVQLTDFVLDSACRQLREWQRTNPEFDEIAVHINVASNDVARGGLVGRVTDVLQRTSLRPRHLKIELTENILMTQLAAAMGTLRQLRELGVGLAVDDFGTGYSSLSHLSVLPIDSLKIDMSFVRNLRVGSSEAAVIRAIVLLGTSLGKRVIAEGIESRSQQEQLRDLGCEQGQGFYLSRPLPPEAVPQLLEAAPTQPAPLNPSDTLPQSLQVH
ncbi:putative bifunctional diguanylate cyclase/phosphodiesterase [Aquabacterium sp.]|uniref:putative bifunctional diguanylate cyclase/phosphodiesterase n=1 Tax=Aquabacterium sp. TaxID=1872578 RepID=UPI0037850B59